MTYAQLKAFHAVAEERSFQRAAQRLYLTQPAVSIQIRNLERDSGRTLFRRGGHRVELTEEGRVLLRLSGTEPVVRVMVEGKVQEQVSILAGRIAAAVESALAVACGQTSMAG